MTDFLHKTPKRAGTVNLAELAQFLEKTEGTVRALQRTNPKKFEMLYMGAVCSANSIDVKKIKEFLELQ